VGVDQVRNLIRCLRELQAKLERFRATGLKETPTRTILIDPILEALGWDVRDPDEVELEFPTVDAKSVDYALKINRRPVLLVEAKSFDDPLADVKAITQVVGYAANAGIVWCILTNGARWRVYRSVEKCEAPDKLMFEVSLDPADIEGTSLEQIGEQMWRFSREAMARGTLDALGERTFTDGKVRKALEGLFRQPPRKLVNLLRDAVADKTLTPQRVRESLARVWSALGPETKSPSVATTSIPSRAASRRGSPRSLAAKKSWQTRRLRRTSLYDERHHTSGKPREVVELYESLDRMCAALAIGEVRKRYLAKYIAYEHAKRTFCCVHLRQGGLRVWLKLKYGRLESPPVLARDVSNIGHWGVGDVELAISGPDELEEAAPLIRRSFEGEG